MFTINNINFSRFSFYLLKLTSVTYRDNTFSLITSFWTSYRSPKYKIITKNTPSSSLDAYNVFLQTLSSSPPLLLWSKVILTLEFLFPIDYCNFVLVVNLVNNFVTSLLSSNSYLLVSLPNYPLDTLLYRLIISRWLLLLFYLRNTLYPQKRILRNLWPHLLETPFELLSENLWSKKGNSCDLLQSVQLIWYFAVRYELRLCL